jgi:hypothetical protein
VKKKLKVSKNALFKIQNYYRRAKRLNELLGDLDKDKAVKEAAFNKKKIKSNCSQTKRLKKPMMRRKKAQDLFKLSQFRLQVAIDMDDEILKMIKHH